MKKQSQTMALPLWDHRLRPYQKQAQIRCREDWRAGAKSLLIEVPTGCGKTHTFVLLPKAGARTLVVVPMIQLIGQTVKSIRKLRDCEADVEQADLWATPETEFVVASWQTLLRNDRWKRFVGKVDLVVVDEAHWGFTAQARSVLQGLVDGGARVLGCTATAYRADKKSLLGFYEKVSYAYSMRQAIDDGYLCPPKVQVCYVKSVDLAGLAKRSGADFAPEELDKILRTEQAIQDIGQLIRTNHKPGVPGIVFCHSVAQATHLRDLLVDRYGLGVSLVHSYMSDSDYQDELAAFVNGTHELIVNVGCLTTGWDHPPVAEVFLAKPTKSLAKYVQMIGRATRTLAGDIDGLDTAEARKAAIAASAKPFFKVFDITDSSRCHQILTCVEVMAAQASGSAKKKIRQMAEREPMTVEQVDAAVQAEIEAERELARLHREEERKKREKLVVGITFDSESRDPFAPADRDTPKRREYRVLFGKYKGQPLRSVPVSYLEWAVREARLTSFWKQVYQDQINFRRAMERHKAEQKR